MKKMKKNRFHIRFTLIRPTKETKQPTQMYIRKSHSPDLEGLS